jgi:hypothetical protein
MSEQRCKCTRCRNVHDRSARVLVPSKNGLSDLCCPKCFGKSWHKVKEGGAPQ